MDKLFYPESIVVIGVSNRPDNLGQAVIYNLIEFQYKGQVYAVGRERGEVHQQPILASLDEVPQGIDLAVILTPAHTVPGLLDACGRKGIRWAVVQSGGFEEYAGGASLQAQLMETAHRWGIRFTGPNALGIMCPESGIWLPFVQVGKERIQPGRVGVLAHSGGLSVALAIALTDMGLGVSKVVSMGNQASLTATDYLRYLLDDDKTEIICLYLEGIRDGRALLETARGAHKPILLLKSQVTAGSAHAAFSHVAAMANDDRIVDGMAQQAGIVRERNVRQLLNLVRGFSLPPVRGDRLLILSRSAGQGVMASDAAYANDFRLAELPPAFLAQFEAALRQGVITPTNPIDLGTIFDFRVWVQVVEAGIKYVRPDAIILGHNYANEIETAATREMFAHLARLSHEHQVPIALVPTTPGREILWLEQNIGPVFVEMEEACRALATSRRWYARRAQPLVSVVQARAPGINTKAVTRLVESFGERPPLVHEALALLSQYGIRSPGWGLACSMDEAVREAERIGYPVALKVLSIAVSHKSDVGGVALNLGDTERVREAFTAMLSRFEVAAPEAELAGIMVQQMIAGGQELIVGGKQDPAFGAVVMVGLGGIYAEVFQDVVFRVAPVTHDEARDMVNDIQGRRLLKGVRGEPPSDMAALHDVIVAVSHLLADYPEIAELDINPLVALPEGQGALALDARLALKPHFAEQVP